MYANIIEKTNQPYKLRGEKVINRFQLDTWFETWYYPGYTLDIYNLRSVADDLRTPILNRFSPISPFYSPSF